MKLVRRLLVVVITLTMACLSGCIHVETPKTPLVDVDVGTSNDGGSRTFDEADSAYAEQLEIVDFKVRRIVDGNEIDAEISGGVKNNGEKTVTYAKAEIVFCDEESDDVHDKDVKLFEGGNLRPGGVRDFSQIYIRDVDKDWKGGEGSVKIEIKKVRTRR